MVRKMFEKKKISVKKMRKKIFDKKKFAKKNLQ